MKQKKEAKAVRVKSGVRNAGSWNKNSTSDPETVADVTFPQHHKGAGLEFCWQIIGAVNTELNHLSPL